MAKVIITTDWRGCRDTVEHGRNGYLVPVRSVPDLVQAMCKVASLEDADLRAMGRYSRTLVEERYDEQRVLDEYLHFTLGYVPQKPAAEAQLLDSVNARIVYPAPLPPQQIEAPTPTASESRAPNLDTL